MCKVIHKEDESYQLTKMEYFKGIYYNFER